MRFINNKRIKRSRGKNKIRLKSKLWMVTISNDESLKESIDETKYIELQKSIISKRRGALKFSESGEKIEAIKRLQNAGILDSNGKITKLYELKKDG